MWGLLRDLALGLMLSHPHFPASLQGSADMDPGDARDLLTGMVPSVSGTWPRAHGHTAALTYPVSGTRLLAALQTHPPHSHWGHRCPSLPLSGGGGCLLTTPSTRWQPSTVHPPRIASDHCFPRCPPLLLSASGHVVSHEGRLPTKLSPGPRWAPNEGGGSQPPGA